MATLQNNDESHYLHENGETSSTEEVRHRKQSDTTHEDHRPKRKKQKIHVKKYKAKPADPTMPLGILQIEIQNLLKSRGLEEKDVLNDMHLILNDETTKAIQHRVESNIEIIEMSANGDGIALTQHPLKSQCQQICIVPFGLPGDKVEVRIFKSHPLYVEADLLKVIEGSSYRNDELINCRYFGKCSGCQFQNVEYSQQLLFKRKIIENAYKNLAPSLFKSTEILKLIEETHPSPLQYGYRTKLTPHFNLPNTKKEIDVPPALGFGAKGKPEWRPQAEGGDYSIVDIEECPIGTPVVNVGMHNQRERYLQNFRNYKKGATFLLRENSVIDDFHVDEKNNSFNEEKNVGVLEYSLDKEKKLHKTCVIDPKETVTEYVDDYKFQFSAGEFFQNNNSILESVIGYVKSNLYKSKSSPTYLVDAYCGSGLFSITCANCVDKVVGVEVSAESVKFARHNAGINSVENTQLTVGAAEKIFENIDTPGLLTSVILDPPRKGSDESFLNHLSDYNPSRVIYISCNVHSQARDIQWFLNNTKNGNCYKIESIKGFDFFPQTHHVESIAVLLRKSESSATAL